MRPRLRSQQVPVEGSAAEAASAVAVVPQEAVAVSVAPVAAAVVGSVHHAVVAVAAASRAAADPVDSVDVEAQEVELPGAVAEVATRRSVEPHVSQRMGRRNFGDGVLGVVKARVLCWFARGGGFLLH